MKIPKAVKLPSGQWRIQLRLGGESYSVTERTKKDAERAAALVKAEYQRGIRQKGKAPRNDSRGLTVKEAMKRYVDGRPAKTSPSTLRGYDIIVKNRWRSIADRELAGIKPGEWQEIVDAEAALWSPKTLRNAWGLLEAAIKKAGYSVPSVTLPDRERKEPSFLAPEQIPVFIAAIYPTKYAVPALLALSSMRLSEILALDWANIPPTPDFIAVRGAVVQNRQHKMVRKDSNKTIGSARNVPILIPELREAIERDRKPSGPVSVTGGRLRDGINRVCREAGLPEVGVHGLRHSFASLAYHLGVPERITMEIGGWTSPETVNRIYTHIAQSDINRYSAAFGDFFKNAHENAHGVEKVP